MNSACSSLASFLRKFILYGSNNFSKSSILLTSLLCSCFVVFRSTIVSALPKDKIKDSGSVFTRLSSCFSCWQVMSDMFCNLA